MITVPMRGMTHDLDAMAAAVTPGPSFVFIANPNNPTGTYNTKTELEVLITLPARGGGRDRRGLFRIRPRPRRLPGARLDFSRPGGTWWCCAFSKAYGLAGVRFGYGVGLEPLIETLARAAAFQYLDPRPGRGGRRVDGHGALETRVALVARKKPKSKKRSKKWFSCVPSVTNFLLVRVSPPPTCSRPCCGGGHRARHGRVRLSRTHPRHHRPTGKIACSCRLSKHQ